MPPPEARSQAACSRSVWAFTNVYSSSSSTACSLALALYLPADLSVSALHGCCWFNPCSRRGGIVKAHFSSSKVSPVAKVVRCFPAVPDDSWLLYSSRLNCRGSGSSRKAPRQAERAQQCLSTSDQSVSLHEGTPCNVQKKVASTEMAHA